MKLFKMIVLVVVAFFTMLNAGVVYEIQQNNKDIRLSDETIKELVNTSLNVETATNYSKAFIKVFSKQAGKENYLYVTLYHLTDWGAESYRLDLQNSMVVNVVKDYIDDSDKEPVPCAACPDPEVQVLLTNLNYPSVPTAESKPNEVEAACKKATPPLKVVRLRGTAENKSAILSYLKCPKLKLWGRIGHGQQDGTVTFDGGSSLVPSDVNSNKDLFKDKFFPINSCYVMGNSFGKAMKAAGCAFMCAGNNQMLNQKSSETTWAVFCIDVLVNKKEVLQAYKDNMLSATGKKDPWGELHNGSDLYIKWDNTAISGIVALSAKELFTISVTPYTVIISGLSGSAKVSIYALDGKLIHQNFSMNPLYRWNMNTQYGEKVTAGNYIAVIENDSKASLKKSFSIVQ